MLTMFKRPLLCLLPIILIGCGGGGGGGTSSVPVVDTGIFLDSRVAGVSYRTETQSGTTSALGEYQYVAGETITFSIGNIILGSALASDIITPLSLVPSATDASHPTVTNIVRLLVSLDSDNNPDNGITINQAIIDAASNAQINFDQSISAFESDTQTTTFIADAGSSLVTVSAAQNHFQNSLKSTWDIIRWDSPSTNNTAWK